MEWKQSTKECVDELPSGLDWNVEHGELTEIFEIFNECLSLGFVPANQLLRVDHDVDEIIDPAQVSHHHQRLHTVVSRRHLACCTH